MNDPHFVTKDAYDPKECFDQDVLNIVRNCSLDLKTSPQINSIKNLQEVQKHLFEGSYFWITGPNFETGTECKLLTQLGLDAVGMSTVPDIVTAAAIGMKVIGIAMISDVMDRVDAISGFQVLENVSKAVPIMKFVLLELIKKLQLKQEIRGKIDSCILFKGDQSLIEEYPLEEPKGIIPISTEEIKGAASQILKCLIQLDLNEIEICSIFLNQLEYRDVIKNYSSCIKLPFNELKNFRIFRPSGKHGIIAIGKLAKSGKSCISICNIKETGFSNKESFFLANLLKELSIKHAYVVIKSNWLLTDEPAIIPISDYISRELKSPINEGIKNSLGDNERNEINKIIRSTNNISKDPDPILFGFEGPLKPTKTEKLVAASLKANAYTTYSLYRLEFKFYLGRFSIIWLILDFSLYQ